MLGSYDAFAVITCLMPIADYELSDDQIVRSFKLMPPEECKAPWLTRERLRAVRVAARRTNHRVAVARWPNGVECLLMFPNELTVPSPGQLLRAYKSAFALRVLHANSCRGGEQ